MCVLKIFIPFSHSIWTITFRGKNEHIQFGFVLFSCVRSVRALQLGDRHGDSELAAGVVRVLRPQGAGSFGAGEHRLPGGGEETHTEPAADERQTQHHPSNPEGFDGDGAAEAARRESARGRPGGDPQLWRAGCLQQRGSSGDLGDYQLRRIR